MLRRQLHMTTRKPLVVMSPKSLLRHKLAVSTLDELANGEFQHLIGDANADAKKVKRVVLCSGKVYYDLLEDQTSVARTTWRSSAWSSCIRSRVRCWLPN
jgi:2-oxoglutarate dehydrogenase E1 component